MTDMTVANEIARQMGGTNRLKTMIGAKDFIGGEDFLTFRWTAASGNKSKSVKITLTAADLYKVEFFRPSRKQGVPGVVCVGEMNGLYNDQLVEHFERETGLFLHF